MPADEEAVHYQLDVDLSTLSFTHHPLFSKEHVLASRLQQYYKHYTERQRKAMSSHYSDKVLSVATDNIVIIVIFSDSFKVHTPVR